MFLHSALSDLKVTRLMPQLVVYYFRLFRGVLTGDRCICIAKPIEGKILFFAAHPHPLKGSNTAQQYKDWNDSGGQRPAQSQVKSKKEKVKIILPLS